MAKIPIKTYNQFREKNKALVDSLYDSWEQQGKKQCIDFAKDNGWDECYVTTFYQKSTMTPYQYMKLFNTLELPPSDARLTAIIPKNIITKTNVYPMENTIKRRIDVKKEKDELLYIVPRHNTGYMYAPGAIYDNPIIYKGYKAFQKFMRTNPDVKKNFSAEIKKMNKIIKELRDKKNAHLTQLQAK